MRENPENIPPPQMGNIITPFKSVLHQPFTAMDPWTESFHTSTGIGSHKTSISPFHSDQMAAGVGCLKETKHHRS